MQPVIDTFGVVSQEQGAIAGTWCAFAAGKREISSDEWFRGTQRTMSVIVKRWESDGENGVVLKRRPSAGSAYLDLELKITLSEMFRDPIDQQVEVVLDLVEALNAASSKEVDEALCGFRLAQNVEKGVKTIDGWIDLELVISRLQRAAANTPVEAA